MAGGEGPFSCLDAQCPADGSFDGRGTPWEAAPLEQIRDEVAGLADRWASIGERPFSIPAQTYYAALCGNAQDGNGARLYAGCLAQLFDANSCTALMTALRMVVVLCLLEPFTEPEPSARMGALPGMAFHSGGMGQTWEQGPSGVVGWLLEDLWVFLQKGSWLKLVQLRCSIFPLLFVLQDAFSTMGLLRPAAGCSEVVQDAAAAVGELVSRPAAPSVEGLRASVAVLRDLLTPAAGAAAPGPSRVPGFCVHAAATAALLQARAWSAGDLSGLLPGLGHPAGLYFSMAEHLLLSPSSASSGYLTDLLSGGGWPTVELLAHAEMGLWPLGAARDRDYEEARARAAAVLESSVVADLAGLGLDFGSGVLAPGAWNSLYGRAWEAARPPSGGGPRPLEGPAYCEEVGGRAPGPGEGGGLWVVAFSLWGAERRYTEGCLWNAQLAERCYPGWRVRVYADAASVPERALARLRAAGPHVEVVTVAAGFLSAEGRADVWFEGMFWRLLAAADPAVERVVVRDCDSRLSSREAVAVRGWAEGPWGAHVMRDHPRHHIQVVGCCWGVRADAFRDIEQLIRDFLASAAGVELREADQHFLARVLWPRMREVGVLAHDSYHCESFPEGARPFPSQRLGQGADALGFVGEQMDEWNRRNPRHLGLLRQQPEPQSCCGSEDKSALAPSLFPLLHAVLRLLLPLP
ncbi:unnamed protein product, partial [Prorocentrum cordatum]